MALAAARVGGGAVSDALRAWLPWRTWLGSPPGTPPARPTYEPVGADVEAAG